MAEHAGHVRRREDPRLVTGTGAFIDDLRVPGALHAVMVRSPHAHAHIRGVDDTRARTVPGVVVGAWSHPVLALVSGLATIPLIVFASLHRPAPRAVPE